MYVGGAILKLKDFHKTHIKNQSKTNKNKAKQKSQTMRHYTHPTNFLLTGILWYASPKQTLTLLYRIRGFYG